MWVRASCSLNQMRRRRVAQSPTRLSSASHTPITTQTHTTGNKPRPLERPSTRHDGRQRCQAPSGRGTSACLALAAPFPFTHASLPPPAKSGPFAQDRACSTQTFGQICPLHAPVLAAVADRGPSSFDHLTSPLLPPSFPFLPLLHHPQHIGRQEHTGGRPRVGRPTPSLAVD